MPDRAARQAWEAALPRLVEDTFRRWHLERDGEPLAGYASLVQPVRDADGVRRACKFSYVEADNAGEIPTLQAWRGRGAVEMLRADPRRGVLLLEWLEDSLEDSPDADRAVATIAGLYPVLHRRAAPQLPDGHALVRGWLDDVDAAGRGVPAPPQLVEWALRAGRQLASGPGTHVVHGDLHFANVMRRGPDWVAIDPKGFNADPCLEVPPLLWNRWADYHGDVGEAIRERFHAVVDAAALDERRARDWVVVRCVINLGWMAGEGAVPGAGLDARAWVTRNVTVAKALQGLEVP